MTPLQTLGKYKIERRIGVGGMAEVFEASLEGSSGFQKRVAIKVLLPHCQHDPEIVRMFIDEATLVARLEHPNIVQVLDFGEAEGKHYMAMEYLDGWDLGYLLQAALRSGRSFPVDAATSIVREVCEALDHVHRAEQQVIHRDVTPQNIFITRRGGVKLGDFGIAKSAARLTRTEDGQIKGKLPYLAPEQVAGDPVSPRTDVYAAGLILFELLAGRRLISAERDLDLLQVALNPPAAELEAIRPEAAGLSKVLRQALERHPTMRHPSARALADDLEAYLKSLSPLFDSERLARIAGELSDETAVELPREARTAQAPAEERPGTRLLQERGGAPPFVRAATYAALFLGAAGLAAVWLWPSPSAVVTPDLVTSTQDAIRPQDLRVADAAAPDSAPPDAARDAHRSTSRPPSKGPPPRPVSPAREADRPDTGSPDAAVADASRRSTRMQERELDRLQRLARSRGLWRGDNPTLDRLVQQARAALQAGATDRATSALGDIRRRVEAFRIDRAFVRAKMARLDRSIAAASLSPGEQRAMAATSQRILHLIMERQLVKASRLMSDALARLARRRRP